MIDRIKHLSSGAIRANILSFVVMTLSVALVYSGTTGHDFLVNWDDGRYITQNYDIRGLTIENLKAAFSSIYVGNYAPVQIVSYMVDYSLFGLQPLGYKLHNILLHLLSGFVFYLLLLRHFSFRPGWALVAALFFLLHPVQVESVAWISQRKTVLSGLFLLSSALAYGEHHVRLDHKYRWYLLSLILFVLALLSKSVAIVLVPLLFLGDYFLWSGKRSVKTSGLKLSPFVATALAGVLIALYTQDPTMGGRGGMGNYPGGSLWTTFLTMAPVLFRYFMLIFWPASLSPVYHVDIRLAPDPVFVGALAFICVLSVAGWWLFHRSRPLFCWYLFIFAALLPVSQLVPLVTLMNDRYLYLPMLGVSSVVAGLGGTLNVPRLATAGILSGLLVVTGWLAREQVTIWKNSLTLWQHAVRVEQESIVARVGYAGTLLTEGRLAPAETILRDVLSKDPTHREAMVNLANILSQKQQYDEAERLLREAVRLYPFFSQGHELLGIIQYQTHRREEAEASFRRVVQLEKNSVQAAVALGTILLEKGALPEAEKVLSEVWKKERRADLAYALGCLYARQGRGAEAVAYLQRAVDLGLPDIYRRLAENTELDSLRGLREFQKLTGLSALP